MGLRWVNIESFVFLITVAKFKMRSKWRQKALSCLTVKGCSPSRQGSNGAGDSFYLSGQELAQRGGSKTGNGDNAIPQWAFSYSFFHSVWVWSSGVDTVNTQGVSLLSLELT